VLKEVAKEVAIELGKLVAKAIVDEIITPAVKKWRENREKKSAPGVEQPS
jgi:hypothetical protein